MIEFGVQSFDHGENESLVVDGVVDVPLGIYEDFEFVTVVHDEHVTLHHVGELGLWIECVCAFLLSQKRFSTLV